ncbi:hypothetical protein [Paenibacillus tyrfis]|uniref:Uncharacterized protein n=1 Tax=Paenibacillus tyrfis TaxID=1501230 RepID=A0A081NTD9_9BACL|nr:hypothetical protein [Paenibacillus tyrfis]KEQ21712.1 hypothetical protein ET33_34215 [Paenibacillus tyrfis]
MYCPSWSDQEQIRGVKRLPLTVAWGDQLLSEAEAAVNAAYTDEEMRRAVFALARLAYGRIHGKDLLDLLQVDDEEILRDLVGDIDPIQQASPYELRQWANQWSRRIRQSKHEAALLQ